MKIISITIVGVFLLTFAFILLEFKCADFANRAQHEDIMEKLRKQEYEYLCYFSAYTFGPTYGFLDSFNNDIVELGKVILKHFEGRFPIPDGNVLFVLFNSAYSIETFTEVRKHYGKLRWRVHNTPPVSDFCSTTSDIRLEFLEIDGFFVLNLVRS